MKTNLKYISTALAACMSLGMIQSASAGTDCDDLMDMVGGYAGFSEAAGTAYEDTLQFGFGLGMWATLMDTSGKVCAVYSVDGEDATDNGGKDAGNTAWLGSRVISAQKANTANAFSLDGLSIPTGAVSVTVYPGGSLYGLQHSNPVDPKVAYKGSANKFGTDDDPLVDARVGGVNVFGGGIALYEGTTKVGAIGVSGDTSCRDATMAYRLRGELGLDGINNDILYLVEDPEDLDELYEQPACGVNDPAVAGYGVIIGDAP